MSKYYEHGIFANMKICVILIIVFTNIVFCSYFNISNDPTCPVKLFRRKRELMEYTRWHADLEPTPEFIVKILDDDLTTTKTRKVIAVNVQPLVKGGEMIILGGAMVPKPTTTTLTEMTMENDYTRFVPPTTVVTRGDGEHYIAPVPPPEKGPIKPHGRHPQRDESPPAAPQFLPRSPGVAWQYPAPITPVGFTRRTTHSPLTPSPMDSYRYTNPIRTSPLADIIVPTRTKSEYEELRRYHNLEDDDDLFPTRSTFVPYHDPQRSSYQYETTPAKQYLDFIPTKERNFVIDNKLFGDKKTSNADTEAAYNMMFYNYDENESSNKKLEKDNDESDDDNSKDGELLLDKNTEIPDGTSEPKDLRKSIDLSTPDYDEPEESDNVTTTITSSTAPTSTNNEIVTKTDKERLKNNRNAVCSMLKLKKLNFNSPMTLPEIVAQLKQWAEDSPVAKWIDITDGNFTAMENPIYMMIVDDPSSGQIVTAKQTVMIVAGIQGRDQHAVTAAMYVLYQLIERSEVHADLLTKYRFWIIPVFNPDGYDYSMTFPQRREWAKNLRQNWDTCKGRDACKLCEAHGLRCTVQPCYGVNLDRNFEYQWIPAEELRLEHPCGDLYAGPRQLSEAETRALTNFLHTLRTSIFTFIAFKEGDVLGVMYPYSHTKKKRTFDHVYRQRASSAAAAANAINGRQYVSGQTSEFLPLYAGGIEDWVDSHLGIDNTYTIVMFRPADTFNTKLITERVAHEAYAAMDTLVLQSAEALAPPAVAITRAKGGSNARSASFLLAFTIEVLAFFI